MTKNRTKSRKSSPHQKKYNNFSQSTKPITEHIEPVLLKGNARDEKHKSDGSWFSKKMYTSYSIVWLYLIIKIFVIDVEAFVLESVGMERFQLFLGLRIFIVPCLLAMAISWKGYKFALRHIFHFLTVPFYFTVFLFAKSVYNHVVEGDDRGKNPTLILFFLEILGRVLSRFNFYLVNLLGFSTLIFCTFYPNDLPIQIGAFMISLASVVAIMYQSVLKVTQPIRIFGFFKIDDIILQSKKAKSILPKVDDVKPKTQIETVRDLLFSRIIITVLQKNVSALHEKKSFFIVAIVDFFVLILTITTSFTFLNYSLFLITPGSFGGQNDLSFSDFAFYSFYAIPGESTSIEPTSNVSKIIKVITSCYGYYLFIFLTSILLGVFSEKFTNALKSSSDFLQQQSRMSEPKLSSILGIPVDVLRHMSFDKLLSLLNSLKNEE